MNAVVKVKETPIFKLGENRQSQEARKVSVDDGFTAIPNELLKAILRSKVLGWKGSYLLATILKTLSWHKESDWFTHSQVCEMMGIEPTKYHVNQLSAARKELIKEQVLFEDGKKTGVNLDVFNWEMVNPEKVGSSRNNRELVPEIVGNKYPEKVGNTKETITKEKINNTPLPPKGESAIADEQPQAVKCEQHSAKPEKIKSPPMDYQAVADLYNQANQNSGSRLPMVEKINDARRKGIKKLMAELREPSLECAELYFNALFASLRPFHTGENGGWVANFDWAIRPATVLKVREGAL
ncbi:replication protein [Glaesserella parasuis]|uniref:Replication protein n=4 Tax=Glaesserella parasuis TaxID=738 RepID=A0A836YZ56_GLAPU|nr:replication protein [Glaesserella parasuis]AIK16393.1 replication protein [Glaesserella parasuis]AIK16859.1 replication protein [Glaesserella parasuis]AIK89380.1 replication protein [Glaesserella parasuis]KDB44198.1 replication protein [Glaesserella parasuis HPS9]KDD80033.1 replication protein [Glaesserella parasuis ST4-1]